MPFYETVFRTELPEITRREFDQLSAVHRELIGKEHKSSGAHGGITADSLIVTAPDWFIKFLSSALPGSPVQIAQVLQASGFDYDDAQAMVLVIESIRSALVLRTNRVDAVHDLVVGGVSVSGMSVINGGLLLRNGGPGGETPDWGIATFSESGARALFAVVDKGFNGGAGARVLTFERGNVLTADPLDHVIAPERIGRGAYLGLRGVSNQRFTEVAADTLYANDGVEERGRTVPMGEYQPWSCTFNTANGNGSIGNGVITARYSVVGDTVNWYLSVVFGSTTNFGTGNFRFSIPQPLAAGGQMVGYARFRDVSAPLEALGFAFITGSDFAPFTLTPSGVTGSVPWTWAAGDIIIMNGTYQMST